MNAPVGILGLGVVGGSLAKDLRLQDNPVLAIEPDPKTQEAATRYGVQLVDTLEGLRECAQIVVCTPVGMLEEVFGDIERGLAGWRGIVSDVAGSKEIVASWAEQKMPSQRFVGAHPMAGGTLGGFSHARGGAFVGHTVAICSGNDADARTVAQLWSLVGATPVVMTAEAHDRMVSHASHLCYLSAVAQLLLTQEEEGVDQLLGRGFTDATRHARFSPEVMAEVVAQNPHIPEKARALARTIEELANQIESDPSSWKASAEIARKKRKDLMSRLQALTGKRRPDD